MSTHRTREPKFIVDMYAPACGSCGDVLHFSTNDGVTVESCCCGSRPVPIRHPVPDFTPRRRTHDPERDAVMSLMREAGQTIQEIALHFDISTDAVRVRLRQLADVEIASDAAEGDDESDVALTEYLGYAIEVESDAA